LSERSETKRGEELRNLAAFRLVAALLAQRPEISPQVVERAKRDETR